MNERAASGGTRPDLVYRRIDAPDAGRPLHPDMAEVRAPRRFDVVSLDATALLSNRLASFGASIDGVRRFGLLATASGIPLAASVVAWSSSNMLDHGPHTRGIVRVRVSAGVAGVRITRRSLFGLRTWRSKLGLMKECALTDPAMRAFVVTGDERTGRLTLEGEAGRALLAMRTILTHAAVGGGIAEVAWCTSTFDEHSVLPSGALVAALEIARVASPLPEAGPDELFTSPR